MIYYPTRGERVTIGDADESTMQRLETHTATLEGVDKATEVGDDIPQRPKDTGHLE